MDKQTFDEFAANIAKLLFSKNPADYNLAFVFTLSAGVDAKPFLKAVADEYLKLIGLDILAPKDPHLAVEKKSIIGFGVFKAKDWVEYGLAIGSFIEIAVHCYIVNYSNNNKEIIYGYRIYGYCNKGCESIGLHTSPKIWALSQTIANFLFEYLEFWKRYKRTPSDRWIDKLYKRNDIVVTG